MVLLRWTQALLALQLLAAPAAAVGGESEAARFEDVGKRVERTIDEWSGTEFQRPEDLIARLTKLGEEAESHVRGLLVERERRSLPVEPLAVALGRLGDSSETLRVLTDLVASDKPVDRSAGARGLGELGRSSSTSNLIDVLDDVDREVRQAAAGALEKLAETHSRPVIMDAVRREFLDLERHDEAALLLGRFGGDVARQLLHDLLARWNDQDALLAALSGLWLCATPDDARLVFPLMGSSNPLAVRRKACLVIGNLRHRDAVPDLIGLLSSAERGLASDAHWALKKITGQRLKANPHLWEQWWDRMGPSIP